MAAAASNYKGNVDFNLSPNEVSLKINGGEVVLNSQGPRGRGRSGGINTFIRSHDLLFACISDVFEIQLG